MYFAEGVNGVNQEPITRSEQRSLFGWDIVFTDRVIFSFEFPAKNICFLSGKFKVQLAVDPIWRNALWIPTCNCSSSIYLEAVVFLLFVCRLAFVAGFCRFDFEHTLPLGTPRFPPSTTSESESTSSSSLLDSLSHSSELSTLSYSLSQDKSLSNSSLLSAMFIKVGKSR